MAGKDPACGPSRIPRVWPSESPSRQLPSPQVDWKRAKDQETGPHSRPDLANFSLMRLPAILDCWTRRSMQVLRRVGIVRAATPGSTLRPGQAPLHAARDYLSGSLSHVSQMWPTCTSTKDPYLMQHTLRYMRSCRSVCSSIPESILLEARYISGTHGQVLPAALRSMILDLLKGHEGLTQRSVARVSLPSLRRQP
jgi:hypothetical protein